MSNVNILRFKASTICSNSIFKLKNWMLPLHSILKGIEYNTISKLRLCNESKFTIILQSINLDVAKMNKMLQIEPCLQQIHTKPEIENYVMKSLTHLIILC